MKMSEFRCDGHVFVAVLKACSQMSALEHGELIHMHIVEDGYDSNVFVANSLINMYAKCRAIEDACKIFKALSINRDMVSWSALLSGYVQNGYNEEALQLFILMQKDGIKPDKVIIVSVLNACSGLNALDSGRLIHNLIIYHDIGYDSFIQSCLIDMYANLGQFKEAREVFDRVLDPCLITWNAIISGYTKHGQNGYEALKLFSQMKLKGLAEDTVAHLSLIKAGSCIGDLDKGKVIHLYIIECGHPIDVVIENALIDLYTKCSHLEGVCKVFVKMKKRTLVTWNSIIGAYSQLGCGQESLFYYYYMQQEGIHPDNATFISLLKACSTMFALDQGRLIHAHIIEEASEMDRLIVNTIIDMYVKCGCLEDAFIVFDKMEEGKDVVSWSAMMEGFSKCGEFGKVVGCFKDMQEQGVKPNGVTFLCLLSVCSHLGLVNEGRNFFKMMTKEYYNVTPTIEHYGCMIDLLAHTGQFDEARLLLHSMPSEFNPVGCISLINHYSFESDVASGK